MRIGPVNKQVTVKDAEPTHDQEEEDVAYLRRRVRFLDRKSLTERRIALAAVTEPYSIPDASRGAGDLIGSVAIFWTGIAGSPSCSVIERGRDFVPVKWGDLAMVAVYVLPNISRTEYVSFLDGFAACARRLGAYPSLVLGDFNAHSTAWGSRRTNGRGRDVQDWTAASRRVSGWEVSPEETLSDHLYILMEAAVGSAMGDLRWLRAGPSAHGEGEEDSCGGR
ncbi:uncharacterized protein LOC117242437 [Bombus vosnesenskii]|uniref:Uncharacterized protein LOC117242437 n=1 Tax=Bombus vosnesenskii TaxID=207650 RepID=A0A6J3LIA3_9HYME|nr:uncharacterized protein LOC117242437 [Bombus vosnesenskii]